MLTDYHIKFYWVHYSNGIMQWRVVNTSVTTCILLSGHSLIMLLLSVTPYCAHHCKTLFFPPPLSAKVSGVLLYNHYFKLYLITDQVCQAYLAICDTAWQCYKWFTNAYILSEWVLRPHFLYYEYSCFCPQRWPTFSFKTD